MIGNGDIVIVEFSDFECPFCGQYARETLPTVKRDLVESGMVRYVVLHYPLETIHPHGHDMLVTHRDGNVLPVGLQYYLDTLDIAQGGNFFTDSSSVVLKLTYSFSGIFLFP